MAAMVIGPQHPSIGPGSHPALCSSCCTSFTSFSTFCPFCPTEAVSSMVRTPFNFCSTVVLRWFYDTLSWSFILGSRLRRLHSPPYPHSYADEDRSDEKATEG